MGTEKQQRSHCRAWDTCETLRSSSGTLLTSGMGNPQNDYQARFHLTFLSVMFVSQVRGTNITGVRGLLLSPLSSSRPQGAAVGGLSRAEEAAHALDAS